MNAEVLYGSNAMSGSATNRVVLLQGRRGQAPGDELVNSNPMASIKLACCRRENRPHLLQELAEQEADKQEYQAEEILTQQIQR